MEIELPITNPFIISYKHHALKLAMARDSQHLLPWIASNYIQLYTPYNIINDSLCDPHWLDFFLVDGCDDPWLAIDTIATSELQKMKSIEQFVEKTLSTGSYLYLYCDSYYLSFSFNYKMRHHPSNMMIYGYDPINRYFHIFDYNFNGSGMLEKLKISYHDLFTALVNMEITGYDWAENSQIYTLKDWKSSLNIELAKSLLFEYINSQPTIKTFNGKHEYSESLLFGKDVYGAVYHYLHIVQQGHSMSNILPFSILWEHKKVINLFVEMFCKEKKGMDDYKNKFKMIEREALIIRNLMLKYNLTEKKEIISSMISKLHWIEEQEIGYMEKLMGLSHKS